MQLARMDPETAERVAHLPLGAALRAATPSGEPQEDYSAVFSGASIEAAAFDHFRQTGFPYRRVPVHVAMQAINRLAATNTSALLTSTTAYDVADSYHPHRFRASGHRMLSPVEAFGQDRFLQRALRKELETGNAIPGAYFGGLSMVSGVQPCSNFRPGIACYYYRRFCPPEATVLDTSHGYGGRLVGFIASGRAGRYIGIDPCRETHEGNARLAADLGFSGAVELHCSPAEDVEPFRERCDFALTSPPYFTKEHYSDEPTQSWCRYPTPDAWRTGFLTPMLRLQFESLKPGAFSVVNVDNVKIKRRLHEVARWTTEAALEVGFELVGTERLKMPKAFWAIKHNLDTSEPVFIFQKPK